MLLVQAIVSEERYFGKNFLYLEQSSRGAKFEPGFGKVVEWDIPCSMGMNMNL